MTILFLFIIGLLIGSFLNVVIDRLPKEENIVVGRSHCEFCKHTLSWYDLIPLLSFLFLKGQCRYCHKWIGWKYPLIELTTGIMFALTGLLTNGSLFHLLFNLFLTSIFVVVFFIDLWEGIIPDVIVLPGSIIALLYVWITSPSVFFVHILSGLGICFFFFLLFAITKGRGMGFGDVKLVLFLGFILGWPGIFICIYLAFLTGAVASLILIILRRKKFHGGTIPFGPFLVLCAYLTLLFGNLFLNEISHVLLHM